MDDTPGHAGEGGAPPGSAGARVLREVIRTPVFLEIIKTNMVELDPESARELVRTLMWEDVGLSLSTVGMGPEVVNYLVEMLLEVGRQLSGFPPPLLEAFLSRLASRVDREKVGMLPEVYGPLLDKLNFQNTAALALGRAVNAFAGMVNRAASRNPYFVRDLFRHVDGLEVARAAFSVLRSITLSLISLVSRLFRSLIGFSNDTR